MWRNSLLRAGRRMIGRIKILLQVVRAIHVQEDLYQIPKNKVSFIVKSQHPVAGNIRQNLRIFGI